MPVPTNGERKSPNAIELLGLAGAGKTTLREVLCSQSGFVTVDKPSTVECLRWLPHSTLPLLPSYVAWRRESRWFTWDEIRFMVYLKAWLKPVRRRSAGDDVAVFDQGPLFRLAVLDDFGPAMIRSEAFRRWRGCALDAWKKTLSLIVWLDAPNDVLLHRVRRRKKAHRFKSMGSEEACNLLDLYRESYEQILAAMGDNGGPTILRFAANEQTTDEVVEVVRATLASTSAGLDQSCKPKTQSQELS